MAQTESSRNRHRQTLSAVNSSSGPIQDLRRSLSTSVANQMSLRGVRRLETRRAMEESHFLAQKARSRPLNPPIDYRQLDYVREPDENLVCAICKCPFVDPVVLDCDHCFCRDCIRQTWTTPNPLGPRGDCPTCRTPGKLGPRSATSKIIVNILDDLQVHCPKQPEGCTATLKRGEVQDHITLYCGYGMVECLGDCELPVMRKDSGECLHFGVCCIDCRQSMLRSHLEQHWKQDCPDRKIHCDMCKSNVSHRELHDHDCVSVTCPGHDLGCTSILKKAQADEHARECPLAKLAPFLLAQKQRLDEQETAQRQMSRKLEVLECGLDRLKTLLDEDPDSASADESRIPLLPDHRRADSFETARLFFDEPTSPDTRRPSADFDENAPYTSPYHHLLSMHEGLRNEVMRISTAMQELDTRHSMQTINENVRTREEFAYLKGQVAGVSRQVHWLTSAQLQTQQGRAATRGSDFSELASAGAGVEAAVSVVSNAVRGAARIVGGSSNGIGVRAGLTRRGTSEEGRTKL